MRKIEKEMLDAIRGKYNFRKDNTEVCISEDKKTCKVYLHGNRVASFSYYNEVLTLNNCGYETNTTKSRLNVLLERLLFLDFTTRVFQKNFCWYIGNEKMKPDTDYFVKKTSNKVIITK